MPRFKVCDYRQKLMIPVSLEEQLVAGTLEHAIHYLIEERVEDSWFEDLYANDQTGAPGLSAADAVEDHPLWLLARADQLSQAGAGLPGECHLHGPELWRASRSQHLR